MDIWQMIANDQTNITHLCQQVVRSMGDGVRSRDRLFDELEDEFKRHTEAMEESLHEALEDHDRTEHLIESLEDEHEEIEDRLESLARSRNKDSETWTQQFEDLALLIDRHFHRVNHELLPLAREILSGQERELRHEFVEEKLEELRKQRGGWNLSQGAIIGAVAGAAAAAIAALAWRSGYLGGHQARTGGRFDALPSAVKHRSQHNRAQRERYSSTTM